MRWVSTGDIPNVKLYLEGNNKVMQLMWHNVSCSEGEHSFVVPDGLPSGTCHHIDWAVDGHTALYPTIALVPHYSLVPRSLQVTHFKILHMDLLQTLKPLHGPLVQTRHSLAFRTY